MKEFKRIKTVVAPRRPVAEHDAYKEGQYAYETGQRVSKNPYHFSSTAHDLWGEGWRDAEFKDPVNKGEK